MTACRKGSQEWSLNCWLKEQTPTPGSVWGNRPHSGNLRE